MVNRKLTKRFIFRIKKDLFEEFEKTCELNDKYPSELFRQFVKDYIENNKSKEIRIER